MTATDLTDQPTASSPSSSDDVLLDVRDLSVVYESAGAEPVQAVDHVSFSVGAGEFIGLVGESGSGKSTLGFAATRLQKPPARINGGQILFGGSDIRELDEEALREQRQGGFAMVLQSGMNALNPVRTIRNHFVDIFKAHGHVSRDRWDARMAELVEKVGLTPQVLARFPKEKHEEFMRRAIANSRKAGVEYKTGGAFGAVIVDKDGNVIADGMNHVVAQNDPTWHGEMHAIRQACALLKKPKLDGCILYTSSEPCPMCLATAYWAAVMPPKSAPTSRTSSTTTSPATSSTCAR